MPSESTTKPAPEVLLRSARTITVDQGQSIFEEGAAGDAAYLVVSGKVKISQRTVTDTSNALAILGPGEVFGELSLFDGGSRSASAHAVTATSLKVLDREVLEQLLHTHFDVATWLIRQLAHRLRRATDNAADLVFSDVSGRTAGVLLDLAAQFGREDEAGVIVEHGLTQVELAQLIGSTRESVNKALSSFAARGWITVSFGAARIHQLDALARRAGRTGHVEGSAATPEPAATSQ